MDIQDKIDQWVIQLESKYGDRRKNEFAREIKIIPKYLKILDETLKESYVLDKPLAVGGTGIVFKGNHKRFNQPIVVKFNRPNLLHDEQSMVENEVRILPILNHPNIIRVLDLDQIDVDGIKLSYLVEPFIEGSCPFFTCDTNQVNETWLKHRITSISRMLPQNQSQISSADSGKINELLNSLLAELTSLFSQWASLLDHLHSKHSSAEEGFVYIDVKPENVLVDRHLHLTSIDYGSVEHRDHSDNSPIEVFYTERYAHPELKKSKKEKASSNRVRGSKKRNELTFAFDYYAFGISMLEILNEVSTIKPHAIPQLPLYRSLHFLATRLLDGLNSSRPSENNYSLASQVFPSLNESDYINLKYSNLKDVIRDLEKERGCWNLEDRIPELATYSKDIVRIVPGFNTVLTSRLRSVIEHPIFARLKYITQLGLISLIYPTADHSRYDHALGSYTYTTNYVKSLAPHINLCTRTGSGSLPRQ
jgi:serine/threonine protein kinase